MIYMRYDSRKLLRCVGQRPAQNIKMSTIVGRVLKNLIQNITENRLWRASGPVHNTHSVT